MIKIRNPQSAIRSSISLYAVIMAGGVGERFWPMSRQSFPKQFLNMLGNHTMIQETVNRLTPLISSKKVFIVSNKTQRNLIQSQLPKLNQSQIILEPIGKNTAPCIGLAASLLDKINPEAVMVVLPSDHVIPDQKRFLEILKDSAEVALKTEGLVTIGMKPTEPETGYGYIHFEKVFSSKGVTKFFQVRRFVEKPDQRHARAYLKDGHYLWNSGMFIWKVKTILDAFKTHLPEIDQELKRVQSSLGTPRQEKAIREMYSRVPKISIDYGIMEKAKNIFVALGDFGWDDVGSWSSLERHFKKDSGGNVVLGDCVGVDYKNSIVISRHGITGMVGVKNLIVVQTQDAVLIIDKSRAQDVKMLVDQMKARQEYHKYL
ncbi:MAG: mannose-1-phosphate guanylyltransferase [Chlamydiae bacterium]|nr:mannose-1-phosphate guanylyltransferase [Chlamydiota bacterium]MBI3277065.1 mannose-1-phosphate guanylyltransferase [Chlamydiota bacterium]